jgi:signal recognition particle receptor subunit beta
MVQINFAHKEIQCKIVYYGPGMSGKTTNLEVVHAKAPPDARGDLTSIATTGERTLYFDYMPLDLGSIAGIKTKFQLYTVPGQIYYKSTRRLVLQGVDGIVFVADSSAAKLQENRESMKDLEDNLREMGRGLQDLPIVVQYNKRDLPDAMSVEDLEREVNVHRFPHFEAVARTGEGVFPTLKALASTVLEAVNRGGIGAAKNALNGRPPAVPAPVSVAAPVPTAPPAPAAPSAPKAPSGPPKPMVFQPARPPEPFPQAPAKSQEPAPRISIAASAPAPAVAESAAARESDGGVAVATLPSPSRAPSAPRESEPAPTVAKRAVEQRMVRMSGLHRSSGGKRTLWIVGLGGAIAAAAWFVLTKVL